MPLKNIFDPQTTADFLTRLDNLSDTTIPKWGLMNASQMLAHLNVPYDLAYGVIDPGFGKMTKLMLKWFVKPSVVGEKPYKKNTRTAPIFKIEGQRNFQEEKAKLTAYITKTEQLGKDHFEGRDYVSFGKMTAQEWSNLFSKHMEHHFKQFGI